MAGWWLPLPQLMALRRIDAGQVMLSNDADQYWWRGGGGCTPQGRALRNKGLISPSWAGGGLSSMQVTPTGKNTLVSQRTLTPEHYKKG